MHSRGFDEGRPFTRSQTVSHTKKLLLPVVHMYGMPNVTKIGKKSRGSSAKSYACKIVECCLKRIECRAKRFECRLNGIDGCFKSNA